MHSNSFIVSSAWKLVLVILATIAFIGASGCESKKDQAGKSSIAIRYESPRDPDGRGWSALVLRSGHVMMQMYDEPIEYRLASKQDVEEYWALVISVWEKKSDTAVVVGQENGKLNLWTRDDQDYVWWDEKVEPHYGIFVAQGVGVHEQAHRFGMVWYDAKMNLASMITNSKASGEPIGLTKEEQELWDDTKERWTEMLRYQLKLREDE